MVSWRACELCCLSLRPSAANEAKLDLGWGSAVLAASRAFRHVANLSLDGDSDAAVAKLEDYVADAASFRSAAHCQRHHLRNTHDEQ